MRPLAIPFLLHLFAPSLASYDFVNNFNWYSAGYKSECEATCLSVVFNTQQCSLANACNSDNCLTLDDSCLCGTTSWLTATSKRIGKSCGAKAVYDAAAIASNVCKNAGVAMAMSKDKIIQVGLEAVPTPAHSTSVQPTAPTTSPSSPTGASPSEGSGDGRGLSTRWQTIIGVVASIILVVTIIGVFVFSKRHRHTREPLAVSAPSSPSTSTYTDSPDAQITYSEDSSLLSDEVLQSVTNLTVTRNANSSIARKPSSNGRHIPGISELEARPAVVAPPYRLEDPLGIVLVDTEYPTQF